MGEWRDEWMSGWVDEGLGDAGSCIQMVSFV